MKIFSQKYLVCFLLIFVFPYCAVFAKETAFRQVKLPYGISIDIPSHWNILSQDVRKNLGAASEAVSSNAKIEEPNVKKESLLAVNAVPDPTGAMIRVSVISPPEYTQDDLAKVTPADLKEIKNQILSMFKKAEASGGAKIIEMHPVRVEKISRRLSLVAPYIRASFVGPSFWEVAQYKIPVSNRLVEVTLSCRKSDAMLWRPILERVKRSLIIK